MIDIGLLGTVFKIGVNMNKVVLLLSKGRKAKRA
jgi:hypothetical protein